jgi:dihydrofolate reductase
VTFVSDPVENVVGLLRSQEFQHVWLVGGGEIIRSFLAPGLIDEHTISFLPIILGAGIPLFPPPNPQQRLELISSRQFENGLIHAHYRSIAAA